MANKKSKDTDARAPETREVREPRESASAGTVSTVKGKLEEFKEFFELSKIEIKKVVWPTRKETMATGIAVLVLVVVMSLFLGVVDLALAKLVEKILS
jgi:preprotein translocase subunit SecE